MARSRLLDALVRAARLSRISRATDVPVRELAERRAEARRLSRRQLLEGAAAAGVLAGLFGTATTTSGCSDSSSSDPEPTPGGTSRVAIVGGGIAGLHCAYRLSKAGVPFTLYEADKSLGGRIRTDRTTFPDGMHCEIGGELIDSGHTTMLDLAEELGIELYDYRDDDASLSTVLGYFDGAPVTEKDLLEEFAPVAAKMDAALAVLTDPEAGVTRAAPNGGQSLDAMSIAQWLDANGVTGRIRKLLEVAFTIEYGLDPADSNVLNMLFLISTGTEKLELFGESDERFHTKTGNATFIEKLAAAIDPASVALERRLTKMKKDADGMYSLSFEGAADVRAEYVVLALPFTILREVTIDVGLPQEKQTAIRELGYGKSTKLMVGFSARPWRTPRAPLAGSNGEVFTDLPIQSTWETSRLQPGASGIITNFTGGARAVALGEGTAESQRDAFLGDWDKIFPGAKAASNGKVVRAAWPTNPFVKASYSAYRVGQYTTIAGVEGERFENVFFCGEHTSLDAQGYMEGGAATGQAAAEQVINTLGLAATRSARPRRRLVAPGRDLVIPG